MTSAIKNIALIGAGQVGTSILLAMAKQGKTQPVTIYDANPKSEALVRQKFAEENYDTSFLTFTDSIASAVNDADLIIIATPMSTFRNTSLEIASHAKNGAILTDTGSAKKVAIEEINAGIAGHSLHYIPAHPGNGSQGAGALTASAGNILGSNSTMFIIAEDGENFIPPTNSPEDKLQSFWQNIGVTTAFITTEKHDNFFGQCSHFQHVLVFSMMDMAIDNPAMLHNFQNAGTALRNTSRVAISKQIDTEPSALAAMWEPIFEQNKQPIINAFERFVGHFDEFVNLVKADDFSTLENRLQVAKEYRQSFHDPERREVIEGDIADAACVPAYNIGAKGGLTKTYNNVSLPALATNLLLPIAISYAQTMSSHEIDPAFIVQKANPSFRDGTAPSTYSPQYVTQLMAAHRSDFLAIAGKFDKSIVPLIEGIEHGLNDVVHDYIINAQSVRNTMPPPRKGEAVRAEYERKTEPT